MPLSTGVCLCYVSMKRALRQPWCHSSPGWFQARLCVVCCTRDCTCWICCCNLYVLKRLWIGRMNSCLFALPVVWEPCRSKRRCGQQWRDKAGWQPAAHGGTGEEQGGSYTATTLMVESKRPSGAPGETPLTGQETTINHWL